MTLTDPRLRVALDAAMTQITETVAAVADRFNDVHGQAASAAASGIERELLAAAQFELRRNLASFRPEFASTLRDKVERELSPRSSTRRPAAATDWQSLSLVEDSEMEDRMLADRIAQSISHGCEVELRELAGYVGSVLQAAGADPERQPLSADNIGAALYAAISAMSEQLDTRKLLARELGRAVAKAMPECFSQVIVGLRARGVQPIVMSVRTVEGPGTHLGGNTSGYASVSTLRSQHGELDGPASSGPGGDGGAALPHSGHGAATSGRGGPGAPTSTRGFASRSGTAGAPADAQLMALLRRLTAVASRPGALDALTHGIGGGGVAAGSAASPDSAMVDFTPTGVGAPTLPGDALTGLMAVNLIRAHRDELVQASGGRLDHMVIDVVGSLFDQILSDNRVSPHMARQIARLQLPVLRVALNDSTFFSSRRHPVRRFVNRIASLACAFDDFDDGPGRQFLARVRQLVQEIVDGDFDQIDLYTEKLESLEQFIADHAIAEPTQQAAVGTLQAKEAELRLQQRYMIQLRRALAPIALPSYLREFLPDVWSQALVLASTRDGPASDRLQRFRRAARDLVMSVQPKGSPALRKAFLIQLPTLMKDLNEGMRLIGWADAAQREFFAKLLPAHAESLKGQPQSELDRNLLIKQLEAIFATPVPRADTLSAADEVPEVDAEVIANRFTAEEAAEVGLLQESAVDWSGSVGLDIDLDAPGAPQSAEPGATAEPAETGGEDDAETSAALGLGLGIALDLNLDLATPEPAEPTRGPQLIDHINIGFAYQMLLKDEWQKVRLAHVSPGRGFFVFTRGRKHQETISMTGRMLARMCDTGRLRAVESAYLMERATVRARKQLAALKATTHH